MPLDPCRKGALATSAHLSAPSPAGVAGAEGAQVRSPVRESTCHSAATPSPESCSGEASAPQRTPDGPKP